MTCRCDFGRGLRTEHCGSCCATFTSSTAGDMHRVGKHHINTGPDRRRCLAVEEMETKGMTRNQHGYWMSPGRDS